MQQISRGKLDRLPRTTAGFTTSAFDGCGLRDRMLARPAPQASNPVLVHRLACLLHASFRPRLATTPLRFTNPSPPSGWVEDFHLQAVEHARHTVKRKQAEACSTQTAIEPTGANDKLQRSGTLISPRVPPLRGSASLPRSPQLPLWATFGVVPTGLSRNERRRFDSSWRTQRNASVEVLTPWSWPCKRSTRFHSKTHCGNEQQV